MFSFNRLHLTYSTRHHQRRRQQQQPINQPTSAYSFFFSLLVSLFSSSFFGGPVISTVFIYLWRSVCCLTTLLSFHHLFRVFPCLVLSCLVFAHTITSVSLRDIMPLLSINRRKQPFSAYNPFSLPAGHLDICIAPLNLTTTDVVMVHRASSYTTVTSCTKHKHT